MYSVQVLYEQFGEQIMSVSIMLSLEPDLFELSITVRQLIELVMMASSSTVVLHSYILDDSWLTCLAFIVSTEMNNHIQPICV